MEMLRDGKFIKEPPIVIGSHYVPEYHKDKQVSEEEELMQNALLGGSAPTDINVEECLVYFFLMCVLIYTIIYLIR
jgi:hypothetical protein